MFNAYYTIQPIYIYILQKSLDKAYVCMTQFQVMNSFLLTKTLYRTKFVGLLLILLYIPTLVGLFTQESGRCTYFCVQQQSHGFYGMRNVYIS